MPPLPGRSILLIALGLVLSGCHDPPIKVTSPLGESQMSADSVGVEIIFARFPLGDKEINGKLWNEVDEQCFPAELRQRLSGSGIRVGLIGSEVPPVLRKLLKLADKPAPRDHVQQAHAADMEDQQRLVQRHLQMRAGHRNEIIASSVYDSLPLLVPEGGELHGQTYSQGQGILALKAFPLPDARVRLELVPEVHHDQPRRRFVGDQGMIRLDTERPRRVFDNLTMSVVLAPGSMIILGSLPDRPGSLGHYFFTEGEDNHLEQKLLVLRLCQTQHDDLVVPPVLRLDD